ncbi:MAG TPA: serine protease [Casimicrobiaceae bacterium]|nr:serine protease [Casimicrobiaceae bacterium]
MTVRRRGGGAKVVSALLAALLPAGIAFGETPSPASFLALAGSVVRVEADRESGALALGTGVTIAPSIVVTNCHVLREATSVRISGLGRLWRVDSESPDIRHDLCFLRIPGWTGAPVPLGSSTRLRPGETVAALGFTGGMGRSLRFGRVVALHAFDGADIIESDSAFTSGASGGGLFDASGTLVGLLTFRKAATGGGYYSLPAEWIASRIPKEGEWRDLAPLPSAGAFWQSDPDSLPYFMRCATVEAEGRWGALLELTDRWTVESPRDSEPLRVRGRALQRLNQPQAAVAAYTAALRLAPEDALAWYGLALAYAALGDEAASLKAEATLASISEPLAVDLRDRLARPRTTQ